MDGWCFATINGRLAELFFDRRNGKLFFLGHVYVERSDYKTKKEQKWIDKDIKKYSFAFHNKEYSDKNTGKIFKLVDLRTLS